MPRVFAYLVYLLLVCSAALHAQTAQQYVFHRLTTENGLSNDFVNDIVRDTHGFLWIATEKGLNRWDGHTVVVYTHDPENAASLSGDTITAVYEDREGRLWVGTYNGVLNLFDVRTEKVARFYPERKGSATETLSIRQIHQDRQGRIWVCRWGGGLAAFEPATGKFTPVPFDGVDAIGDNSQFVKTMHELPDGTFLLNGWERYTYRFNPASRKCTPLFPEREMSVKEWKKEEYIFKDVHDMQPDADGNIWIGSYMGVGMIDKSLQHAVYYKNRIGEASSLSLNNVWAVQPDADGRIWCGTYGSGLDLLDPATGTFQHFRNDPTDQTSISSNVIKALYRGPQGVLWIATSGGGVSYLDDVERRFILMNNELLGTAGRNIGSKRPVQALHADAPGTIYVGTMDGYNVVGPNGMKRVRKPFRSVFKEAAHYFNVFGISRLTSGELLAYSFYRLHIMNEQTGSMKTLAQGRGDDNGRDFPLSINSVVEGRNGMVYGGADFTGLWSVDTRTNTWTQLSAAFGFARLFRTRDGQVWVATDTSFGRYDISMHLITPVLQSPVAGSMVQSVLADSKGRFWVVTTMGLYRLDAAQMKLTRAAVNAEMVYKDLLHMYEDPNGDLWISCSVGLYQFSDKLVLKNFFDKRNGLPVSAFDGPASQGPDGIMYFASNDGVVVADPNRHIGNNQSPPVVISGVKLFNKELHSDTAMFAKTTLNLAHGQSVITFQFAALNFIHPSENRFAYKLEGFDRDWVYALHKREITYTNLDPGTYVFRVKASNNDGIWNEQGAALTVVIAPPWYLTWWAYLMYAVVAIGAIVVTDRARKRVVMRKLETEARIREAHLEGLYLVERERNRIARDVHDLIGANLTRISLLGGIIQKKSQNSEDVTTSVDELSAAARETVESFDEIVWAADPQHDTLEGLLEYLIAHVEHFLEVAEIDCELHVPLEIPPQPIAAEVRHNVFLVVVEALNNTAKYAGAQHVALHAGLTGEKEFTIRIEDDGRGFSMKEVGAFSNGLNNMRERMTQIHGTFAILSAKGEGTVITLTFPLQHRNS